MPVLAFTSSESFTLPNAEPVHWVLGWSLAETGDQGYDARVRFFDGKDATGTRLATIHLEPSKSKHAGPFPEGQIPLVSGSLYVQVSGVSGGTPEVEGTLWYA
jgi:hypothetical protein